MPTIKADVINPAAIAAAKKEIATFRNTGKWTNVAIRDAWQRGYNDGRQRGHNDRRAQLRKEVAAICAEIWYARAESAACHDE